LWAGFQIAIVVVLFVVVLLALLWGDKKRLDDGRTIADKILSCFKIVIGFYQVSFFAFLLLDSKSRMP
jgi:hypothetical protein